LRASQNDNYLGWDVRCDLGWDVRCEYSEILVDYARPVIT